MGLAQLAGSVRVQWVCPCTTPTPWIDPRLCQATTSSLLWEQGGQDSDKSICQGTVASMAQK